MLYYLLIFHCYFVLHLHYFHGKGNERAGAERIRQENKTPQGYHPSANPNNLYKCIISTVSSISQQYRNWAQFLDSAHWISYFTQLSEDSLSFQVNTLNALAVNNGFSTQI
jgi:hypothetical protein